MKKVLLLCFLTLPFLGVEAMQSRQMEKDSVFEKGWWQRYSKKAITHKDTTFEQWVEQRNNKKVRFDYDLDFSTYFDNREYDAPYQIPQTFFNFRLSPSLGVAIRDRNGGRHRIMAGLRHIYPMGGDWTDLTIDPTAYYLYEYQGLTLSLGLIPYEYRLTHLPDWLMYDSLVFMHPNIQGALFSYHSRLGNVSLMCDWRGSRSWERREMFRVILDGQFHYHWFMTGGLAHLNHTAFSYGYRDYESLYDDMNLSVFVGADFSQYTVFDSLAFKVHYIGGYNRDRRLDEKYYPQGVLFEFCINWWLLGLKNTLYVGDNLQPHRAKIGDLMCLGDPFYQSTFYNRTDLFVYLYRSSFVNFYFSWNLHCDDNYHLYNQQQLCVRFNLNGVFRPYKQRKSYLRGLLDK